VREARALRQNTGFGRVSKDRELDFAIR